MGKASQRVQSERRMQAAAENAAMMAEYDVWNLPRKTGDALGCLQWHDFRSGKVRKWVIRIGNRRDRITAESPGATQTASHGWTWFLTKLRKHIK